MTFSKFRDGGNQLEEQFGLLRARVLFKTRLAFLKERFVTSLHGFLSHVSLNTHVVTGMQPLITSCEYQTAPGGHARFNAVVRTFDHDEAVFP